MKKIFSIVLLVLVSVSVFAKDFRVSVKTDSKGNYEKVTTSIATVTEGSYDLKEAQAFVKTCKELKSSSTLKKADPKGYEKLLKRLEEAENIVKALKNCGSVSEGYENRVRGQVKRSVFFNVFPKSVRDYPEGIAICY